MILRSDHQWHPISDVDMTLRLIFVIRSLVSPDGQNRKGFSTNVFVLFPFCYGLLCPLAVCCGTNDEPREDAYGNDSCLVRLGLIYAVWSRVAGKITFNDLCVENCPYGKDTLKKPLCRPNRENEKPALRYNAARPTDVGTSLHHQVLSRCTQTAKTCLK